MKKLRFKLYTNNTINEISYLLEILQKEKNNLAYSISAEINAKSDPYTYILTYLDKPNTTIDDLDANIIKHDYVRLVSIYVQPTKLALDFLQNRIKFDYEDLVDCIQKELLNVIDDFEYAYKKNANSSILFITLYNCKGSYDDFKKLNDDISEKLSTLLIHRRKIYIAGVVSNLFEK